MAHAETATYTYDSLNRLTRVQYPDGSAIEYTYDAAGNRLSRTVTSKPVSPPPGGGGGGGGYVPPANQAPTADAGPDQTATVGNPVTLTGTGTDPDNGPSPLVYAWIQAAGPTVALTGGTTPKPSFTPTQAGTYTFSLTVNDGKDNSPEDSVTVTVKPANKAPAADAGPDQAAAVGSPVTLTGTGTDPDNGPSPLAYAWIQAAGPTVALTGGTTPKPSFTPTQAGTYTFSLTVSDGKDSSPADSVTVTIKPANKAPAADAGPDQAAAVGSPVTLTGTGTDPDNGPSPLTFAWTQTAGPTATLTSAETATPGFIPAIAGDYVFNLVVNDGQDNSPADSVTVTVKPANKAPAADAGPDQTATVGSPVTLTGTGMDPDNGPLPLTYAWTQSNGPAVTLVNATTATPVFTPTAPGDYAFSLVVNDGKDASAADIVLITVKPAVAPTPANQAPIADAGSDRAAQLGDKITLDGRSSADPDNGPAALTYQWLQTAGPAVPLDDASTPTPSLIPTAPGVYAFSLTVSDGSATSSADTITVTVADVAVRLLAPNGGEVWKAKTAQTIRWYASGALTNTGKPMKLKFSKNSGKTWRLIKTTKANVGLVQWKPQASDASSRARVQICLAPVTKKAKPICDTGDGDFVIRK